MIMDALVKLLFFAQSKSSFNQISDCDLPYSYFTQTYVIHCNPIAPRNSLSISISISLSFTLSHSLLSSLSCEALRSICSMRNLEGSLSCHVVAWCKSKSILWSTQIRGLTHTHEQAHTDRRSKFVCDKPRGGNNPLPTDTGTGRTLRIRQKLKMLQICNPYSKDVEFFTYRCGAIQTEYPHTHTHLHTHTQCIPVAPPGRPTPCVSYLFKFYFLRVLPVVA